MKNQKSELTLDDLLLVLIGIIGISFTTYQTTKGYELDFGSFYHSLIFSILIGLSLAFLMFRLRVSILLRETSKTIGILLIYSCVALLSFFANFNYFFTETMKQEIIYNDIEDLQNSITILRSQSLQRIKSAQNIEYIKEKCAGYKSTLIIQISDKANSGWGSRSQIIIDSIENLLGVKLTKTEGDYQMVANSVSNQIDELLRNKINSIKSKTNVFESRMITTTDSFQKQIDSSKANISNYEYARSVVENGVKLYNQLCAESMDIIGNDKGFHCTSKTFKNKELGRIGHSIKICKDYISDAIFAAIKGGFIDIILPILMFVSSNKRRRRDSNFIGNSAAREKFPERSKNHPSGGSTSQDLDAEMKSQQ